MLISFEGIDGSGKGTQLRLFLSYLKNKNLPYIHVREPGGTELGEILREIVLKGQFQIYPKAELLLFLASRAQLVSQIILPALKENKVVVADRFIDSSVVYQGVGRELGPELVEKLNDFATDGLKPDLTFYIDVPVETALKRKRIFDRIESEGIEFLKKVRKAYLELARKEKRIFLMNGEKAIEEIHSEIILIFEQLYWGIIR
ncbi:MULTISPECIES: dTMP kinase [Pseudothermotoga]|jgi:dTMP kinase|uniref:Thymidylate kinase n=1 Tax=Pseudothermotoga lettingae (strain ATCC BAA-301 / DSM 14385 / NBRC 107922 / TMO) TaxID=416591 RepID=A8F4E7_PSELT|nr:MULTISPECIES: dTMP kinase [Pseudothermotoga]ABV33031.1 dTMP kinase [Pseudothermotoga lettingae TMO]KUK22069.1 MAG: Thymidylate kinase [Pseudothermotoga lettingae]MDI3494189.1 dTMP kinase [Pseudothermotoga sp.]MDK2884038.1 dTMP kinase [Pseudothermotoga sp.]GLI47967.1 thymidylate kinase [Pseudothermotoga lettingae TMO]